MQKKLAITPKTTTNQIRLHKLQGPAFGVSRSCRLRVETAPDINASQAETCRRGLRRMVWLSTQEDPVTQAKQYPDWTKKALLAISIWQVGYDDLTGDETAAHIAECHRAAV